MSTQRSGTKLLGNCFQSGTVITPFGEVFNPDVPQLGSFAEFMRARGWQLSNLGNSGVLNAFFAQFEHICSFPSIDVMFNQVEIPCVSWNDVGSPYALYSYFREVGAFVILLDRDPFDSFVSRTHLSLVGGPAHRSQTHTIMQLTVKATLNEDAFRAYREQLVWHRNTLKGEMRDYESFFELQYSELAGGMLPMRLADAISSAALRHETPIDAGCIQIHKASMKPSGVDYASVFENYEELRAQYATGRGTSPSGKLG